MDRNRFIRSSSLETDELHCLRTNQEPPPGPALGRRAPGAGRARRYGRVQLVESVVMVSSNAAPDRGAFTVRDSSAQ